MADEKEVIVTREGGGGTAIIAVVVLVAILVVLFLVFKDRIVGGDTNIKADVKVEAPAKTGN